MRSKIEYVFLPGELAARGIERVGATALRLMQGIPRAFDSYGKGKELKENYIPNELETLARDLKDHGHKPDVARLDAQRIADLVWLDYTRRKEGGEWQSPGYLAQVTQTMADCRVPKDAMLDTLQTISAMPEPPKVRTHEVPTQLTLT